MGGFIVNIVLVYRVRLWLGVWLGLGLGLALGLVLALRLVLRDKTPLSWLHFILC